MRWICGCVETWVLLAGLIHAEAPSARLDKGLSEAAQGNCQAALIDLQAYIKENTHSVAAINTAAICHARTGSPELATREFEKVANLEPDAWQAWNNLGASYLSTNQMENAVQALRRAVKLAPGQANPWFHLGSALAATNRVPEAFDAFDHAERISPQDSAVVKGWLGTAGALATQASDLIENKDYTQARKLLETVGRPLAESGSWHNLLGYAEFKLGHPESALAHLQRALVLEPNNEDFLLDMGEFLGYYRVPASAVQIFEVASKRMPNSPRVQFGLAISYILLDRREEATSILETLVSGSSRFEPAYAALGECYEDAGNSAGLISLGKELQAINPQNPTGWYLEGTGQLRSGLEGQKGVENAVPVLREAVRISPQSARFHFTLAKALESTGENEAAAKELQETVRLEPRHERAHYLLGRLYQKLGQPELARAQLEEHRNVKAADRTADYRALLISSRPQ